MQFKRAAFTLLLCCLFFSGCSVYKSSDRKAYESDYASAENIHSLKYLSCTLENEKPICTPVRQSGASYAENF